MAGFSARKSGEHGLAFEAVRWVVTDKKHFVGTLIAAETLRALFYLGGPSAPPDPAPVADPISHNTNAALFPTEHDGEILRQTTSTETIKQVPSANRQALLRFVKCDFPMEGTPIVNYQVADCNGPTWSGFSYNSRTASSVTEMDSGKVITLENGEGTFIQDGFKCTVESQPESFKQACEKV